MNPRQINLKHFMMNDMMTPVKSSIQSRRLRLVVAIVIVTYVGV